MTISNGWYTKQVDYTNEFSQAKIQEDVYIETPHGFEGTDKLHKVLKLITGLYRLK